MKVLGTFKIHYQIVYNSNIYRESFKTINRSLLSRGESGKQYHGSRKEHALIEDQFYMPNCISWIIKFCSRIEPCIHKIQVKLYLDSNRSKSNETSTNCILPVMAWF